MICAVDHINIVVFDLERSLGFYTKVLGFKETHRAYLEGGWVESIVGLKGVRANVAYVIAPAGAPRLELLCYESPTGDKLPENSRPNTLGLRHLALGRGQPMHAVQKDSTFGFWCNYLDRSSPGTRPYPGHVTIRNYHNGRPGTGIRTGRRCPYFPAAVHPRHLGRRRLSNLGVNAKSSGGSRYRCPNRFHPGFCRGVVGGDVDDAMAAAGHIHAVRNLSPFAGRRVVVLDLRIILL